MRGSYATPSSSGSDSGSFKWYVRGVTPNSRQYDVEGAYHRARTVTLRKKNLSLTLHVEMNLGYIGIDPSSGELSAIDKESIITVRLTDLRWRDGRPIMTGPAQQYYAGTVRLNDDGTAGLVLINEAEAFPTGTSYTIDTERGELR